jgi:hypothetical protein
MSDAKHMRDGFEKVRKDGVNVDWFTWQIAWTDARLFSAKEVAHPPTGDAAGKDSVDAAPFLNLPPAMTPYGMLVRALRIVAETTLYDMAKYLKCGPAMLSGIEFGREPLTDDMVARTAAYFSSCGILGTLDALNAAAIASLTKTADDGEKDATD